MKYKKIIYFLYIISSLYFLVSEEFEKFEFQSLIKDVKKFYIFSNNTNPYIAYLDKDMNLKISSLQYQNNAFFIINSLNIYKYQKEDELTFLKAFYYNNKYYIAHIEKFSQKLILTYFDKNLKPKNLFIKIDNFIPQIFISDNSVIIFYITTDNKIIFKSVNLKTLKENIITGEKNISNFKIVKNGNFYAILWKFKDKKDYLYFSIMDNKLKGFSKIYKINYKKEEMPYLIFNNEFVFAFINNENLYFFILEKKLTNNSKNYEYIKYKEIEDFSSGDQIINFTNYQNYNIIILKATIQLNKNESQDLVKIVKFDKEFNLLASFLTKRVKGRVLESYFFYNNELFLFILDSNENMIKYLAIF